MKIAIIGTRGIPNRYGGFEQFAELVSKEWVNLGHEVICYSPHDHEYQNLELDGVKIKHIYCPETKLGALAHVLYDFLCLKDAVSKNCDIYLQLGYQSSAISFPLFRKKIRQRIITNMDGMEWKRSKWSKLVKVLTKASEYLAVKYSGGLISDNEGIANYFDQNYGVSSQIIKYGCDSVGIKSKDTLKELLDTNKAYDLVIARLEPENNIKKILRGFIHSDINRNLLVIGNADTEYGEYLKNISQGHDNIIFLGSIYDKDCLDALRQHSVLYFHGHSVGGTNPSLLEAMAAGSRIIAHNNEFNKSILGSESLYFNEIDDLSQIIKNSYELLPMLDEFKLININKIKTYYKWEYIAKEYENNFLRAISK